MSSEGKEIFDDIQFLYPEKGDKVFEVVPGDWLSNACIKFSIKKGRWAIIADGYKLAGDILSEYVKEKGAEQDFLIFPIAFNYRHNLELLMKYAIEIGLELYPEIQESKEIGKNIPTHHRLNNLWDAVRKIIMRHENMDKEDNRIKAMKEIIDQFSKLDPGSSFFRYPMDKDRKVHDCPMSIINIETLSRVMTKASNMMNGICMSLSVALDIKMEIEADFASEYMW